MYIKNRLKKHLTGCMKAISERLQKKSYKIWGLIRKKLINLLDNLWGYLSDDLTYSELEKKYYQLRYQLKQLRAELDCLRNNRL